MKKTFSIFLALVMLVSTFAFSASAASYPSAYPKEYSYTAKVGDTVSIVFTVYHKFQNEKITSITYDEDGAPLASAEQTFRPSTYTTEYTLNWDTTGYAGGDYTIVSQMSYYSNGQWNDSPSDVTVRITLEGENDSKGETVGDAIILSNDVWNTKPWTKKNYSRNCYNKIQLPARGYITFTMKKLYCNGELCTVDLSLHNADGKAVWTSDTSDLMKDSFSETCEYKIGLAAGTYYMNITPNFSVTSGRFDFEYKYAFTEADNWEIEPNNTAVNATAIELGKTYTGAFCEESYSSGAEDNFSFQLESGKRYSVTIENFAELNAGTLIEDLIDPDGKDVYWGDGKSSGNSQIWTFVAEKTGKYILKFDNESDDKPVEYKICVNEEVCAHTPSKDATCTTKAVCDSCGAEYGEVNASNHTDLKDIPGKEATCTEKGLTDGKKCSACGALTAEQKEIPATGHKEVAVPGKEATCTEEGLTEGKKCSACGEVIAEQEEVAVKGHKEVAIKAKAATYTSTGLTAGKKCSECGKVTVKQKKVAKKKLKKVTISSVKSTKAKQVNVSWKKVADATGFVVEYSTSKKFTKKTTKKVTIKKAKTLKTTLKKLKSGKKYYVRVKAYKTVGKKTVYGSYSAVKTVKVK